MALVDMHSSWLVINSIVGCTNACKYCLLQDKENNLRNPKILGTPKETIKELLQFKFYDPSIPLCLFPNTDIFLNEQNRNYLLETLKELEKNNISNDLILITKCFIPLEIIEKLKAIQTKGINIVVYLSYSGLDKQMEPHVNHEEIKKNFQNLKDYGIPIIHYYRPFIEENSKKEKITETLDFVAQYTPVSVVTGLMYVPTMMEKNKEWEYLNQASKKDLARATSIWPEEAWQFFYESYNHKQNIYGTNTCALNTILKRASKQYYGSYECTHYNHCSEEQKKICNKCYNKNNKQEILEKLDRLLKQLGITESFTYEWDEYNSLKIEGVDLEVKTLSYLSYRLGIKIYSAEGRALNDIYNSSLNGAKPFILRRKKDE